MSCGLVQKMMVISQLILMIHSQTETRFYYFDFNGNPDWRLSTYYPQDSINVNSMSSNCPRGGQCWEVVGYAAAYRLIPTTNYHSIRITIGIPMPYIYV